MLSRSTNRGWPLIGIVAVVTLVLAATAAIGVSDFVTAGVGEPREPPI